MTVSGQLTRFAASLSDPVMIVNAEGSVVWANNPACRRFGADGDGLAGRAFRLLVDDSEERVSEFLRFCFRVQRPIPGQLHLRSPGMDASVPERCTGTLIPARDGAVSPVVCIRILSASHASVAAFSMLKRRVEDQNRTLRTLFEAREALKGERDRATVTLYSIGDGVITTDAVGRIERINPVAEGLTGWRESEAVGRYVAEIFHLRNEHTGEPAPDPVQQCLRECRIVGLANHTLLIARDGTEYCIEDSAAPIFKENEALLGVVLVFRDVTAQRLASRQLEYLALRDPITTLPNRRSFEQQLETAFRRALRGAEKHALIYIDLDQFKLVNDTAGHQVGDQLLIAVARHLNSDRRGGDVLARLGGDEFGLLASDIDRRSAIALARSLVKDLHRRPFNLSGTVYRVGASAGVAAIDRRSVSTFEVMRQADIACYVSKRAGRGRAHMFSEKDYASVATAREMRLSNDILDAMAEGRLRLVFQPIVIVADGQLSHYEVLLRMSGPDGTDEPTASVIAAAERYGLMGELDRWVIEAAFAAFAARKSEGAAVPLTINLSGESMGDPSLRRFIFDALSRYSVPPADIVFEVTETSAISGMEHALNFMQKLRAQGCQFALDDFGTGFSSFAYLKGLPLNYLKIDGSFVRGLTRDHVDQAMVRSMVAIARSMGMVTVAECVESQEVLDILRDVGVDLAQGFHISRPLDAQAFQNRAAAQDVYPSAARGEDTG